MTNLETLLELGKAAMASKENLEKRIAENEENWKATSNLVKDCWTKLELSPRTTKVGATVVSISSDGIVVNPDNDTDKTPTVLAEVQYFIQKCLERAIISMDDTMQN